MGRQLTFLSLDPGFSVVLLEAIATKPEDTGLWCGAALLFVGLDADCLLRENPSLLSLPLIILHALKSSTTYVLLVDRYHRLTLVTRRIRECLLLSQL